MSEEHKPHSERLKEIIWQRVLETEDAKEALTIIDNLEEQLEAAQRKLSCGYETGTGTNCGECLDCLKVNWHFAQEAVGNLKEQLETLREEHKTLQFAAIRLCNVHRWSYGGPETLVALAERLVDRPTF